jgi:hypothetical protein
MSMELSGLGTMFASLPLGGILWSLLGLTFIVFGIYSVVMLWHWKEYSTGKYTTAANMFVYLGVSVGFIMLMFLAASWYSLS